jgi:hypothetical protein
VKRHTWQHDGEQCPVRGCKGTARVIFAPRLIDDPPGPGTFECDGAERHVAYWFPREGGADAARR